MKKFAIIVASVIFAVTAASAGNNNSPFLKVGAKFGIGVENQNTKLIDAVKDYQDILNDPATTYHVGLTLRLSLPLLPVFVQGEALYNWSRIKSDDASVNISTFNAPVLVGLGLGLGDMARLRINAGPVFNFNTNVSLDGFETDLSDILKKPTVTWTAGVGADLLGLMLDVRYNGQFKDNKVEIGNMARPSSWSVSVGFMF